MMDSGVSEAFLRSIDPELTEMMDNKTIPEKTMDDCPSMYDPPLTSVKDIKKELDDAKAGVIESDSVYGRNKVNDRSIDDPVNHPSHYTSGQIECIDFIDDCGYGLDFCLGNAMKYLTRCKKKGTCEQDLRKAAWYAQRAADGIQKGIYKI